MSYGCIHLGELHILIDFCDKGQKSKYNLCSKQMFTKWTVLQMLKQFYFTFHEFNQLEKQTADYGMFSMVWPHC